MRKLFKAGIFLSAAFGLAPNALAYNPISTYHYLADPAATADSNYFYIITDSDDPAAYNATGYNIKALYAFRSKDMQNWTDMGIIYQANRETNNVSNIWASGIDIKDGKFYIIFPDGASSVGLIKADSINGPYENAVSGYNKLIGGGGQVDCGGVAWCFDPSIFVDDDGSTWVTFGGGENDAHPNTNNFILYKMNDQVNGVVTSSKQDVSVTNLPTRKMLEASYIHKYNGKYYFSYSTGWQQGAPTIDYAMSDKVTGPYTWKGTILADPNIDGKSINGNNNHHGLAEFKGHWYAVYHDRRIAKGYDGLEQIPASDGVTSPAPNEGYHRSVSVDEMFYNADGTIQSVKFTNEGPTQIENFDPYDWYPALTSSKQRSIRSRTDWTKGKAPEHILTPQASRSDSWIRVSGVDFGTAATAFVVEAASVADNNKIELHKGSATGTLAGTCTLKNTGSWSTYVENTCEVTGLSGIVEQLFMVFKGDKDSTMGIRAWGFEGSGTTPPTPQSPFGGKAWAIPGTIQMENFDEPGSGRGTDIKSYNDNDSENHGDSDYRDGTGVDLYAKSNDRIIVGYNQAGEWLEYTVNVAKTGDYTMFAAVASANATSSFMLSMDGEAITDTIAVPQASEGEENYDDYNKVSANVTLTEGEHILRFTVTGDWMDIDYINFVSGKDATDDTPIATDPTVTPSDSTADSTHWAIATASLRLDRNASTEYRVFDLQGHLMGTVNLTSMTAKQALKAAGFGKGVYLLREVKGVAKMMVNTAR